MGTDYIFSSAFVRSNERKLLKAEQFRAMTDSGNIDEICSTIQNAGYGSDAKAFRPDTYQEVLKDNSSDMFEEIKELAQEYPGLDVLVVQNDYHNIKVLLKAEELGVDRSDILLDKGTIPVATMVDAVRSRSGNMITEFMFSAIMEAAEVLGRTKDPQLVDFICDKYCFMEVNRLAAEAKNDFIQGYAGLTIDVINLKTYIRVKNLGQNWTYFKDIFVPGGNIDEFVYGRIFDADAGTFAASFNGSALKDAVTTGRDNLTKTGDYAIFEKLCDEAIVDYIRDAKSISFGVEVLFAYLVAKQMEIKNIRILMAAKLAGMEPEDIAERIRKTYE